MFDEMENDKLERINDWFEDPWRFEYEVQKNIYFKRFEHFLCKKNESLYQLNGRYAILLDTLKEFKIRMSIAEEISKFVEALPLEWDEFLIELKKDSRFSKFYLSEFVDELQKHETEIKRKKKDLINKIEEKLDKISLDMILEISRRVNICLGAKNVMKYDIKRGCYIDKDINPLDFIKKFSVGTFKTDSTPKNEESEKKHVDNAHQVKSIQDESM
ncbi:hypothetical protein HanIR_Chr09g0408371 [Helianthus annuus]|nr:hypothetical protein HanIR_Chr09g0408371 [Helianthus annuus]